MHVKIFVCLGMYTGTDQDILRRGDRNRNDQQAGTLTYVYAYVCVIAWEVDTARVLSNHVHACAETCIHIMKVASNSPKCTH